MSDVDSSKVDSTLPHLLMRAKRIIDWEMNDLHLTFQYSQDEADVFKQTIFADELDETTTSINTCAIQIYMMCF